MKPEINIENWSTGVVEPSQYAPPEALSLILRGEVVDEQHPDGTYVRTSSIVKVDGNRIETMNSIYILGKVNPLFVLHCEQKGCHVPTKEVPILVKDAE